MSKNKNKRRQPRDTDFVPTWATYDESLDPREWGAKADDIPTKA